MLLFGFGSNILQLGCLLALLGLLAGVVVYRRWLALGGAAGYAAPE